MAGKLKTITGRLGNSRYCSEWLKVRENCDKNTSPPDGACVRRFSHAATNISASGQGEQTSYKEAKPFCEIPGPKGLPYLGTLLRYKYGPYSKETYHLALLENYHKYGKIFKETIAGRTKVHLLDPDYISLMYQHEDKMPHIPPLLETTQLYRKIRNLSPGLGNTNGEEWYRLRSAVQQMMMRPQAVSMFLPQVNDVIDDFIERLTRIRNKQTGEVQNFKNELLKWNLESSASTCFEFRFGCLEAGPESLQQQMINASRKIFELSLDLAFGIPWFRLFTTPTLSKLLKAEDFFFSNGQKLVDQTVAKIKSLVDSGELKQGQYKFLTYLMQKEELDYKDMSIITLSLFADGLSTTVPSLIGQLYCLATNQDKQDKLYDSIKQIAPNQDKPITNHVLSKCQYLKACIKEGFRFFPIGVEVSRIPKKDVIIGGYHIPAGTHVELNNNLLLRLPEYFNSPDKYLPERWMRGQTMETVHPYLLLPFGFGPRTCAGRRFAEQEMQVLIIRLLQNYRIEWPHADVMTQRYCMLLTPNKQPLFRFIPRK